MVVFRYQEVTQHKNLLLWFARRRTKYLQIFFKFCTVDLEQSSGRKLSTQVGKRVDNFYIADFLVSNFNMIRIIVNQFLSFRVFNPVKCKGFGNINIQTNFSREETRISIKA